jgi:hypothetical protein
VHQSESRIGIAVKQCFFARIRDISNASAKFTGLAGGSKQYRRVDHLFRGFQRVVCTYLNRGAGHISTAFAAVSNQIFSDHSALPKTIRTRHFGFGTLPQGPSVRDIIMQTFYPKVRAIQRLEAQARAKFRRLIESALIS